MFPALLVSLPAGAARAGPMPGPDSVLARPALPTYCTWRPPRLLPGSRAAPGGARAPAAARGAAPARAGGGCAPRPRPGTPHFPCTSQRHSGTPDPVSSHLRPHSDRAPSPRSPLAGRGDLAVARACDAAHPGRPASPVH